MMAILPLILLVSWSVCGQQPPVLPSMWISETIDPPEPSGIEAYNFVANPSPGNPSAMWSNYSDCQRLIYDVNDLRDTGRYPIEPSLYFLTLATSCTAML
jgi:hypothetical protein